MKTMLRNSLMALSIGAAFGTASLVTTVYPAVAQSSSNAADEEKGPSVSSTVLENGLQVVVIPDRRAPVVTHMVWYKAGSADEPPGKSGIAHYLEHLMFKGTKSVKAGEFSALVASIGGQENAFTSTDYTAYYQRVTPDLLGDMMRLEADRMENLVITNEVIDPERKVVIEERNSRTENRPEGLFNEAMSAALYRNHRYGIPIIGWRHEIDKLDKDAAIAFYDKFYTPNNAILVVAGDVEADAVIALAKQHYGKVARRAEPGERMRPSEPPSRAARRLAMSNERVRTPSFQRQYLASSYFNSKDGPALDILSEVLGGSSTSRIYQSLVVGQKLATSAGAWYQGGSLDDTTFGFYASPLPGKTLADVEEATDKLIVKLLQDGITEKELARGKNRLLKAAIFDRDSQTSLARIYGASMTMGATIEVIQSWPERIRAVTVDDVNKAAKKYLDIRRSVTGTLSPKTAPKEG